MTNYPLAWPADWPRKNDAQRADARFGRKDRRTVNYTNGASSSYTTTKALTVSDGVNRVLDELGRLGGRPGFTVISANVAVRLDACRVLDSVSRPTPAPPSTGRTEPARRGAVMKRLIETTLDGEAGCILSDCEQYRYRLWRQWDDSRPALGFIMLNPSTADHQVNDPTITRCMQRAQAGKYGRLEVVNLFPLRSTDPDGLLAHAEPLGREDTANGAIMDAIDRCSRVICAWGAHKAAPARAVEVLRIIRMCGRGNLLYHLGLNQDGTPKHPLYVAAKTRPARFTVNSA